MKIIKKGRQAYFLDCFEMPEKLQLSQKHFRSSKCGEVPNVPRFSCAKMKIGHICTKIFQFRFMIGRVVSQRIITLNFFCSNCIKLTSRIVTAAVAPARCELATIG